MIISEIFGPTWQGEGPAAGRAATFLRLAGCNLDCSWCDTPYSWDWENYDRRTEATKMTVAQVAALIPYPPTLLVITGGEPLIQHKALSELATLLPNETHVETNGTVAPPSHSTFPVALYVVSPKLDNSGVTESVRYRPEVIDRFVELSYAVFKFVATSASDFVEIDALVAVHTIDPERVWIMPEGTDETLLDTARSIADETAARGYNLTLRNHTLLWPGERKR